MADQINTTADMLAALQDEISAVKDGTLEPDKARIVGRFRKLQLDTATLHLQYQRLHRAKPSPSALGLLSGTPEPVVGQKEPDTASVAAK